MFNNFQERHHPETQDKDVIPSVRWKPLHLHSFYQKQGFKKEDYPVATRVFDQIISLPLFTDITMEQIDYVTEILEEVIIQHNKH